MTEKTDTELAMFAQMPGAWLERHDFDGKPLRTTCTAHDAKGREYYVRVKLVPAQDWEPAAPVAVEMTPDD